VDTLFDVFLAEWGFFLPFALADWQVFAPLRLEQPLHQQLPNPIAGRRSLGVVFTTKTGEPLVFGRQSVNLFAETFNICRDFL
jgi:hypothetical protein